ncbi:hypothetical protein OB236_38405 [Paenibacillus sp. WQ 127069]|uniref:Uncharacterized protein n=1 Tax=Paenibacillus baimaensis TaxID=2982185 RepID=A0ABT2UTQ1_9BACL|nr:hypothetical protein [Paenibacillus sp. WQ 127069]MCU6798014.1 hypothetical protein [Paenibacillus sp. WQ 127069]
MPNQIGWYTKEEVLQTPLPYYIPSSDRWTSTPYPYAVLLTKSRCAELGMPILRNGAERPSAFKYSAKAGIGTDDKKHRYIPLYDRTSVFTSSELLPDILYKGEIMEGEKANATNTI